MQVNQNLSFNFTLSELIESGSAKAAGIDNTPSTEEIANLEALCRYVLQPIRDHFNAPVRISSGFRCPKLNRLIGGQPDSQHTKGEAADITVDGVSNQDLFKFIFYNLNYDQVIAEKLYKKDGKAGWVHVSYTARRPNRKEPLSYLGRMRGYVKGLQFIDDVQ